jgi:hypothetical protein
VNNPATAPQYPPRNANLDVVEGNLQRILKEIPRGPQPRLKPGFSSGAKHRPQVLGHGRRWRLNRSAPLHTKPLQPVPRARLNIREDDDNGCHRIL